MGFNGVLVRGGGDLASGAIARLVRSGLHVIVFELGAPLLVRRTVCFGDAVYEGTRTVEGLTAHCVDDLDAAQEIIEQGEIPVLVDPDGNFLKALDPLIVVDARMEKQPLDCSIDDAPLVIALGPGYLAGVHAHAIIETNRGHRLGRVYWTGGAEPNTAEPGSIGSHTHTRVLRAPSNGHVEPETAIGEMIRVGQTIAHVSGEPVIAPFAGVLRGLIHRNVDVFTGMKIGDLDPRIEPENCFTISDKSLAVGGGVLEAVMTRGEIRARLGWSER